VCTAIKQGGENILLGMIKAKIEQIHHNIRVDQIQSELMVSELDVEQK
jgi:hypothetical protein